MCTGGGPPITVPVGGMTDCTGTLTAISFTFGLCTCHDVGAPSLGGAQLIDGYNSALGPYTPGGLGAGVGTDGAYITGGGSTQIYGDLWSSSASGISLHASTNVYQQTHVLNQLNQTGSMITTMGSGYVGGPLLGRGSFGNTLHTTNCATVPATFSYPSCMSGPISFPPPCACGPSDLIPIGTIVPYYAVPAHNDNASIGLSPSLFDSPGGPGRLDLPCGHYYLDRMNVTSTTTTIAVHGHTALFIGGSVYATSALTFAVDPTATFDLFIAGTLVATTTLTTGSPAFPVNMRVWVGGVAANAGAPCTLNADCWSETCTAGTCAAGAVTTQPFSVDLHASVNLAGDFYAAYGEFHSHSSLDMYGAIFAGYYQEDASTAIHYDRASDSAGAICPPPPGGCSTCRDCGNQACIAGMCSSCTDSSQCCAPLVCQGGMCVSTIFVR
jgi:hypothetical protein